MVLREVETDGLADLWALVIGIELEIGKIRRVLAGVCPVRQQSRNTPA